MQHVHAIIKREALILSFILFFISSVNAQDTEWITYNTGNSGLISDNITAIAVAPDDAVWLGTPNNGIVKFDGTTWTNYNQTNAGLPSGIINDITFDKSGNVWAGISGGGLAKYDGTSWTFYNKGNSGIPNDLVYVIEFDQAGSLWIGTGYKDGVYGGLVKYDGTNWTVYDSKNSGIPDNAVYDIFLDPKGIKWLGTGSGVARFDDQGWKTYNRNNTILRSDYVYRVVVDQNEDIWAGLYYNGITIIRTTKSEMFYTSSSVKELCIDADGVKWAAVSGMGLGKFNGTEWTFYDQTNSKLPNNIIDAFTIDRHGNKWISTKKAGLTVFREGGVVSVDEGNDINTVRAYRLIQNYPNPFNPSTVISYELPEISNVELKVFDMLGREIASLVNGTQTAGHHDVNFNASGLAGGMYICRMKAGSHTFTSKMMLTK